MAEHAPEHTHAADMEAHRYAYRGFVKGAIALSLISAFTLVALVAFRFGQTFSVGLGFLVLVLGTIAVAIDFRTGSRWLLSLGLLVLLGLITAVSVS